MPGDRVPQPGEVWVFAHFKREDQRHRSRVRVDLVTDDDVMFTRLRHGGEQTAVEFRAFVLNYQFAGYSVALDDEAVSA